MRYSVTLATFGNVAHHGGRHDHKGLSLPRARKLVERFARRGARRYGAPSHSFAARYWQVHASYMAQAAHCRRIGRHAAALEYIMAARLIRLERPGVERREATFGAPLRSGFVESLPWGSRGGAFPIGYASGVITLDRF